jgi:hypothetical protein
MTARGLIPRCSTAVVAVSLLASSAGAAVPHTVDPLVALSVLGTSESRAALCAGGAAKTKAAKAVHTDDRPPCMLPKGSALHASPPARPLVAAGGIGPLPLYVGLAAVVSLAVIIKHSDSDGEINLPISP